MLRGLLTRTDENILRAMHRYRYMTAEDVTNLLFSPGALTHVRALLTTLSGGDFEKGRYLYRFLLPDAKPGNPRRVYTLGRRGKEYGVEALGLSVDWHFKPERARFAGFHHLQHSLALTRMLVAAEIWSGKQENYKLEVTQTSYDLARLREMTQSPLAIPDAWLLFMKKERKYPILLEIDMGSENINKFKEHILARIELIQSGKYEEIFGVSAVLISYLGVGESSRLSVMAKWTEEALKEQGLEDWGQIFKIGYVNPSQIYNQNLFTDRIWRQPFSKVPVPLFDQ